MERKTENPMHVLFVLILISLALAAVFLLWFLKAARDGEFDDTTTPGMRVLFDDQKPANLSQKP